MLQHLASLGAIKLRNDFFVERDITVIFVILLYENEWPSILLLSQSFSFKMSDGMTRVWVLKWQELGTYLWGKQNLPDLQCLVTMKTFLSLCIWRLRLCWCLRRGRFQGEIRSLLCMTSAYACVWVACEKQGLMSW